MKLRTLLLGGVIALFGAGGFLLMQTTSVTKDGIVMGKVPEARAACTDTGSGCRPTIHGTTLDGHDVSEESLRGKIVMVNYWATWCGPCIHEIPALESIYKKHQGDGFVILGVASDQRNGDDYVKQFAEGQGITYPVMRSTAEMDRQLGVPDALPTSYLYDRDGRLQAKWTGGVSAQQLEDEVGGMLVGAATGGKK